MNTRTGTEHYSIAPTTVNQECRIRERSPFDNLEGYRGGVDLTFIPSSESVCREGVTAYLELMVRRSDQINC